LVTVDSIFSFASGKLVPNVVGVISSTI